MKKIVIFKNGSSKNGQVMLVPESFEELLLNIKVQYNIPFVQIFTSKGEEINDISLIKDNDILYYVSCQESFITPTKIENVPKNEIVSTILCKNCNNVFTPKVNSGWVTLNVGGKYFTTSRSTLISKEPSSMLARMFAVGDDGYLFTPSNVDSQGAYLIDRSPMYFEPIINYLRNGLLLYDAHINPEGILEEAKFFGIQSLIPQLENIIQKSQISNDDMPLTRRDVINSLITTSHMSELRFQGVNLLGADLSKLDLRNINFKYACLSRCKLTGANLSRCCLERADLSYANLEGVQLLGVKGLCANFEGANLRGSNFEDSAGSRANMESVNLKGAILEGSNMAGVNLRVATLRNANLQNCNLRAAVLAGADLECCDLSGSDLQEANLRGANLRNAAFELMLTPLHMSQTIR